MAKATSDEATAAEKLGEFMALRDDLRGRSFSLSYLLDVDEMKRWHEGGYRGDRPFLAALHERDLRLQISSLNDGRTLNPDGSCYRPAVWEDHERDLALLTVGWPLTVHLAIDRLGAFTIAKTFRGGRVIDLAWWPSGGSALVEGQRIEHRAPRPCPQMADGSDQPSA